MIELDTKPLEKQLRKVIAGLKDLSKNEAKKIMRTASRASCKVIQPVAKQLAPVDTGFLKSNIRIRAMPRSRVWMGTRVQLGKAKKPAKPPKPLASTGDLAKDERRARSRDRIVAKQKKYTTPYYFSFIELGFKRGGRKVHGQHFLQRAFRKTKKAALEKAIDVARAEFSKALAKVKT